MLQRIQHLRRSPWDFAFLYADEPKRAGLEIPENLLRHISPLGWEHIHLTGEYRWPRALNSNA